MTQRVFNFNPGPAALPLFVLEQAKMEMLDFRGSGMSVLEISHRPRSLKPLSTALFSGSGASWDSTTAIMYCLFREVQAFNFPWSR